MVRYAADTKDIATATIYTCGGMGSGVGWLLIIGITQYTTHAEQYHSTCQ